jgi:cytochrome c oxidase subunit II
MTCLGMLPFIPERASTLSDHFEALFWYISITCGLVGGAIYVALL